MSPRRAASLAALLALARAVTVQDAAGLAPPDGTDALLATASPLRLVVLLAIRNPPDSSRVSLMGLPVDRPTGTERALTRHPRPLAH